MNVTLSFARELKLFRTCHYGPLSRLLLFHARPVKDEETANTVTQIRALHSMVRRKHTHALSNLSLQNKRGLLEMEKGQVDAFPRSARARRTLEGNRSTPL